jgi:hypothetical protein
MRISSLALLSFTLAVTTSAAALAQSAPHRARAIAYYDAVLPDGRQTRPPRRDCRRVQYGWRYLCPGRRSPRAGRPRPGQSRQQRPR